MAKQEILFFSLIIKLGYACCRRKRINLKGVVAFFEAAGRYVFVALISPSW